MLYTDEEYANMTTYHLQLLFGQAIIGSEEYYKTSSILSQREEKELNISKKTLRWSKIAGIAAIFALAVMIVSVLLSIFQSSKP